ncbi:Arylsulfatase [Paramyrothecium foliicola]|nr:Arylsulfatase [Paramyrothecium foliicola]
MGAILGDVNGYESHVEEKQKYEVKKTWRMPWSKSSNSKSTQATDATAKAPGKDPDFGTDAATKTMYEKSRSGGYYEWAETPPKQLSKAAARAQDRVAIKIFKTKDLDKPCIAGRFSLKHHMIEVQNSSLVAALEPILKKEAVHLDVNETAKFESPFQALWFCQNDIIDLCKATSPSEPVKKYLDLLVRVLDDLFGDLRLKKANRLASNLVDYDTVWTLFPRGSTLYTYGVNSESLSKVQGTREALPHEGNGLLIKVKVLEFNGKEYIWKEKQYLIPRFKGRKPITELQHYPFEFHARKAEIQGRLTARGRKALDYQGLEYRTYNGIAIHTNGECSERHNVEGRVLIDVVGYNKYHLAQGKREASDPKIEKHTQSKQASDKSEPSEDVSDGKRLDEQEQQKNKEDMLANTDDLCFISEFIGGYALKNKKWSPFLILPSLFDLCVANILSKVKFFVEDIEPMVWNSEAYSHLVYDEQQKDLVLSFVENHGVEHRNKTALEDVILGKGQGLIILLSGPPGTGKTLTAEAVADRTKRPLFYLQAEDLGISASILGTKIKRVFEMATDWNAVILLDEADVFMAERHPTDIHRNELVSIFLRELEYFRGIIFLTTNLYSTIDSAFRSRVSLHLRFQQLSRESRESVWRKFLERLPDQKQLSGPTSGQDSDEDGGLPSSGEKPLDEEDLHELSLWRLNGREIKNAIKMVQNWCFHKGYLMTLERLESGIRVTTPHASKDGDVSAELYD